MQELDHACYMHRAIALGATVPDVPFGAVIAHRGTGEIVAEGWNRSAQNATWHGEIDALNALFRSDRRHDPRALVLYTTAEPCPMCMAAILWSGIGMVVFGTSIRFLQANGWKQIDILADEVVRRSPGWACQIVGGVLEPECNALFVRGTDSREPTTDN